MSWFLAALYPALLSMAADTHGNRLNAATALEVLQREPAADDGTTRPSPERAALDLGRNVLSYNLRFTQAWEAQDEAALEDLLDEDSANDADLECHSAAAEVLDRDLQVAEASRSALLGG